MRSSTILLLTLRALSQETIKNLVLAGVGRLIVMDDKQVSEEDLGAGLLFREEEGDVGKLVSVGRYDSSLTGGRVERNNVDHVTDCVLIRMCLCIWYSV